MAKKNKHHRRKIKRHKEYFNIPEEEIFKYQQEEYFERLLQHPIFEHRDMLRELFEGKISFPLK